MESASSPVTGGGADIKYIPTAARARIQRFANEYQVEVVLVGSRAAGTATSYSDWDYIVGSNAKTRRRAREQLPRGQGGGEISYSGETGIDIFNSQHDPLDRARPHIIFTPQ